MMDSEEAKDDADCQCSSSVVLIINKFLLFLINLIVWLLGVGLLALGIYLQVDESSTTLQQALTSIGTFLTNPAISLIVIGAVLFIIGFCGCFGALLEIYFLLVIYAILIVIVLLGEIALVTYIFIEQEKAYSGFEIILRKEIELYYSDINIRDIIDVIQRDLLKCCGINSPDDWQSNIYFNCSSPAFQRCSVPPSCCLIEEGEIVNLQCGYQTLNETAGRYLMGIYTTGCVAQARTFVNSNLYVILGAGGGLLVFQVICVILSVVLAVIVKRGKDYSKKLRKQEKLQNLEYKH